MEGRQSWVALALGRVQPSVWYVGMYTGAPVPIQGLWVSPQCRTIATLPGGTHLREILAREEIKMILSGHISTVLLNN